MRDMMVLPVFLETRRFSPENGGFRYLSGQLWTRAARR